jgi:chromosome transmission fidelity protein 8
MASVTLHPKPEVPLLPEGSGQNPLPQLLQTPSGLALLELQGTINLPDQPEDSLELQSPGSQQTPIGRLVFPDYDPKEPTNTAWMKRIYLYVGRHQRLTGEVKKLPKAIAVIRKRTNGSAQNTSNIEDGEKSEPVDELEIVEIVKHKILFSLRPEPVGTWAVGDAI